MTEPIQPTPDAVNLPKLAAGPPAAPNSATLAFSAAPDLPLPPEQAIKKGEHFYAMGQEVARGGMGAILQAKDLNIERTVAMKVTLKEAVADSLILRRFTQEAKLTGQLEHPNIVPVHDLSVDEQGRPFYTMKFVKGVTLLEILAQIRAGDTATISQYSLAHLLTIYQKVCDAVAFAHSKQVIHRDLKPANIMVGEYGEVLVMDWGLAKVVGGQQTAAASPESVVPSLESSWADVSTPAHLPIEGRVAGQETCGPGKGSVEAELDETRFSANRRQTESSDSAAQPSTLNPQPTAALPPATLSPELSSVRHSLWRRNKPTGRWRHWMPEPTSLHWAACCTTF